jgi:glycosyltransferase involved in cell wall biosynthesis
MRVALTVEQLWHVVPGGIATSTVELARALVARGDLDLVGVAARHERPPRDDLAPPLPVAHARLSRRPLYASWQWLRAPRVERIVGGAVDVVHDLGYAVPPSRAPLVATVHDLLFRAYPEHYTRGSLAVLRRGVALARRHARLVVCPSDATARACVEEGFAPERLRVIPWGVRTPSVGDDAASLLARHGIEGPFVLFCGTVEPRKNLRRVLAAMRALDRADVRLVLAGPKGWKEDLDGGGGAPARVTALGFVPPTALWGLYRSAEVVVYPSLAEGFGLPVLEAMAAGAAVVTSRGTAMEEVAGDAAVLVDPLDAGSIAAGIDRVLGDRALAARLGQAGRERAAAYTWERAAERVAGVYAEAAGATG